MEDNSRYYRTLGVKKNATLKDVNKAYLKSACKHRPVKEGDEEKFKEVSEAYEALKVVFKQNGEPVQPSFCRRIYHMVDRRLSNSRRSLLVGLDNAEKILAS